MKSFFLKARTGPSFSQFKKLSLKTPDSIYFMGICGTAMASLAVYLKQQGFNILGSDQNIYPPMSETLKQANISVSIYNKNNIKPFIQLIIVGNVISKNHEEMKAVQNLNLPCLSLPEFLEQTLLCKTKNIVVAGTHGKSTSTALISHIGQVSGKIPGFFIGAIPKNFSSSFHSTGSPWFIIEGDEYDTSFFAKKPKFFYYNPFAVLLTGIEFDHGDIYNDLDEITDLFCELIQKLPKTGCLTACSHNKQLEKVIRNSKALVTTYGKTRGDYIIKNRHIKNNKQVFDIHYKRESFSCSISLFGEHNAINALGVFALLHTLGWPVEKILQGLTTFKGVKKRLEFKGELKGAKIYEDFAHHPSAVEACLSALKERYSEKKLIALFEPRSFTSRINVFQKTYIRAFIKADLVFIAKTYDTSKIPEEKRFSSKKLVQDLKQNGKQAHYYNNFKDMKDDLNKKLNENSVVVFMSSGNFGGLLQELEDSTY